MTIQEIDQVYITILMDNSTDLLLTNSNHANRPPLTKNEKFILPLPVAETWILCSCQYCHRQ